MRITEGGEKGIGFLVRVGPPFIRKNMRSLLS